MGWVQGREVNAGFRDQLKPPLPKLRLFIEGGEFCEGISVYKMLGSILGTKHLRYHRLLKILNKGLSGPNGSQAWMHIRLIWKHGTTLAPLVDPELGTLENPRTANLWGYLYAAV